MGYDGGAGRFNAERAGRAINLDKYGNYGGPLFDLAKDGPLKNLEVGVLHLYTGEDLDLHLPAKALEPIGFSEQRLAKRPASDKDFAKALLGIPHLWVI